MSPRSGSRLRSVDDRASGRSEAWKNGLAIGLGYFAVSFAFGIYTTANGFPPLLSTIISLTNLSSAGQFAGVNLILTSASLLELAATVLLINLRYFLMAMSMVQHLEPETSLLKRLLMGYAVTDEIFAVSVTRRPLTFSYFRRLMLLPVVGWTSGTACGAWLGEILPETVSRSLGIALYAMFIAIVLPVARCSKPVLRVSIIAAVLSLIMTWAPYLDQIPYGWRIIICTAIAAAVGATLAPIEVSEDQVAEASEEKEGQR